MAFFSAKHLGAGQYYLMTIRDKDGKPFDGSGTYRLTVPANAPVKLYWSATVYDRATHALIREPAAVKPLIAARRACRRTPTARWTSISAPRRRRARSRTGCRPARMESSRCCSASTARRSRSSTRRGCCRISRRSQRRRTVTMMKATCSSRPIALCRTIVGGARPQVPTATPSRSPSTTSSAPNPTCTWRNQSSKAASAKLEHRREPASDRQPDRHPAQPRHALFVGGVRPRCGAGDDHAARRRASASCRCRSSTRTTIRPQSYYGAGSHTLTQEEGRHALRHGRGIRTLVDPADPEGCRAGPRAAGRDQGRASQAVRQVRSAELGSGQPEEGARRAAGARHDDDRLQDTRSAPKDQVDPVSASDRHGRRLGRQSRQGRDLSQRHACQERRQRPSTSSTSRTCRSMASGRSASTTPRAIIEKNPYNAYSLNNITAKKSADGSVDDPVRRLRRQDSRTACRS